MLLLSIAIMLGLLLAQLLLSKGAHEFLLLHLFREFSYSNMFSFVLPVVIGSHFGGFTAGISHVHVMHSDLRSQLWIHTSGLVSLEPPPPETTENIFMHSFLAMHNCTSDGYSHSRFLTQM